MKRLHQAAIAAAEARLAFARRTREMVAAAGGVTGGDFLGGAAECRKAEEQLRKVIEELAAGRTTVCHTGEG